jgi:ribonuclease P protein component
MRRSSDFTATVRRGRRARRGALVVHQLECADASREARVGLIVPRAVGASTARHRVARRLRHVLRAPLDELPAGSGTVVRALPAAAQADSAALDTDLTAALLALRERDGALR